MLFHHTIRVPHSRAWAGSISFGYKFFADTDSTMASKDGNTHTGSRTSDKTVDAEFATANQTINADSVTENDTSDAASAAQTLTPPDGKKECAQCKQRLNYLYDDQTCFRCNHGNGGVYLHYAVKQALMFHPHNGREGFDVCASTIDVSQILLRPTQLNMSYENF
jgi:hypothetical protein